MGAFAAWTFAVQYFLTYLLCEGGDKFIAHWSESLSDGETARF